MERHRPDETDVSRAWPNPDWAGVFGTIQNPDAESDRNRCIFGDGAESDRNRCVLLGT